MGLTGADEIAASVKIEKGPVGPRTLQINEFRRYTESVDRVCQHPFGHWEEAKPATVQCLALVGNWTIKRKTAVAHAKIGLE